MTMSQLRGCSIEITAFGAPNIIYSSKIKYMFFVFALLLVCPAPLLDARGNSVHVVKLTYLLMLVHPIVQFQQENCTWRNSKCNLTASEILAIIRGNII